MTKLLRFELQRCRIFIIAFTAITLVASIVLKLIDRDSEEIVISLSVLLITLPWIGIIAFNGKNIVIDTHKNTRLLYLSLPYPAETLKASKLMIAAIEFLIYTILLISFMNAHVLGKNIIYVALILFFIGLILEVVWIEHSFKKNR